MERMVVLTTWMGMCIIFLSISTSITFRLGENFATFAEPSNETQEVEYLEDQSNFTTNLNSVIDEIFVSLWNIARNSCQQIENASGCCIPPEDMDSDTEGLLRRSVSLWKEALAPLRAEGMTSLWTDKIDWLFNSALQRKNNSSLLDTTKRTYSLWKELVWSLDEYLRISRLNDTTMTLEKDFMIDCPLETGKQNEKTLGEGGDVVTIHLRQGAISSRKEAAGQDRFFYSFKGIPYAEPPTGRLRLQDPVPAPPWKGIRNGSVEAPLCPQQEFYITVGNEDCLYLNVYTPRPFSSDLPVMVWIHGGHFILGGANEFHPLPLLTKDVVLVVVQYRLGALGFLSTEDEVLPGNLGLKDQSLALRWVQENIRDLGGDPRKVTVFGEGAGAASVHFHVLSPRSKGLFQRVILQSGNGLNQWALRTDHKKVAMAIGSKYNCTEKESFDSSVLLKCLQDLPLNDLVEMPSLFTMIVSLPLVMTPRVDGDFLPAHPAALLREGRYQPIDIVSGVNMHEGATIALPFVLNPWLSQDLMDNFEIAGPTLMAVDEEESSVYLAREIYHHYLGNRSMTWDGVNNTVRMISDLAYKWSHAEVTQLHATQSLPGTKVFAHELQYRGQHSFTDLCGPEAGDHWITNGDELPYLFNYTMISLQLPEDLAIRKLMVDLWTNFALHGDPTPFHELGTKWLPVADDTSLQFLAIDSSLTMRNYDSTNSLDFWRSLPTVTNKLLYPERFAKSEILSQTTQ
ncbi:venom carboxylesterase-6-like isoform X2 [Palaemon carinicauda]|uniref:venom carboxylesterase-6-like isoform X2 n=1 Tax=Palaemon carinicauda TaxID=392227 RepID=UPI0035B66CC6